MNTLWIPLKSVPAQGKSFVYEDTALWQGALDERHVPGRLAGPVRAEVFVLPQEDGALFRGKVAGVLVLPCDRCQEDCEIRISESFDSFEPYPVEADLHTSRRVRLEAAKEAEEVDLPEVDAEVVRQSPQGKGIEINPAALALEEFILGLPLKPLCSEDCRGLCAICGKNRNEDPCDCAVAQEDPRLAPLKKLSFGKK